MQTAIEKLVSKLASTPAPFGFEDRLIGLVRDELKPYVDKLEIDTMGNVIGTKNGTSNKAPRVMISAHMDEVGFIVKCIEPTGYLRFHSLGYIPENTMQCQRVIVSTDKGSYSGVIGVKAYHAGNPDAWKTVPPVQKMYVDVGARSKEEAEEMGIKPGSIITFDYDFKR